MSRKEGWGAGLEGASRGAILRLLGATVRMFNRLSYSIFRSPARSRWLYPLLAAVRNRLLKLLGRNRVNNLGIAGNDRF